MTKKRFRLPVSLLWLSPWLLLASSLFAAETDGFTTRYAVMGDGVPEINTEIRRRVDLSLVELNLSKNPEKACDWKEFGSILGGRLRRPMSGLIESFINRSLSLRFEPLFSQSVYKTLPLLNRIPMLLGSFFGIGFGSHISHDGLLIGADKFGHFMDEGYYYYTAIHDWGYSLDDALGFGAFLEDGIEGGWTSGIYSYADLAANYDGYLFWRNVLGVPSDHGISKYFSCSDGVWKIKNPIDLATYITAAWDEGMNCDEFRSVEMTSAVDTEIKTLELREKKRYACPVFPERLKPMIDRYGEHSKRVIHPKLLNGAQ